MWKAAKIAIAYKGSYTEEVPGPVPFGCSWPISHSVQVMQSQSNNSYKWKTNGWQEQACNNSNDYEDISHAVQTLIYPRAINKRLGSNNTWFFDDDDMIRFRNTFSFHVYAGSVPCWSGAQVPQFHAGVDGDDVISYDDNGTLSGFNNLKSRSLAWMPFYKWDNSSGPNVYDIVMDYYACDILYDVGNIIYGITYYGLSEVVAAQWDKECVNLTLYNRDVLYDQDFVVKNKIVVAPQANTNTDANYTNQPFADPYTFTDGLAANRFLIEAGNTVNMVSGETIELLPGFETNAGSFFSASIDQSVCTDGLHVLNTNGNNNPDIAQYKIAANPKIVQHEIYNDTIKASVNKPAVEAKETSETNTLKKVNLQNSLSVSPNPFNTVTNLNFSIKENSMVTIKITDQYGHEIFSEINNIQTAAGNYTVPFYSQNLSGGIYYCILQINGQIIQVQKIILIKQ